jgi:thiol-disulfide isomerase/thioredoxin
MMKHLTREMTAMKLLLAGALAFAGSGLQAAGEGWLTNFDEASAIAKETGKHVMIEFHGSDWCPPCIKLNDEVLSTATFKDFAKDKLVLVNADFPRRSPLPADQRAHNQELAERFGITGFPTVVILDPAGNVLDKAVGYPRGGLDGFISFLEGAMKKGG